ncbi:MAG: ornithine cyclodeaminase family protein [Metallibacterium scheffleri]|jgi:ornithine cyclodeaminase/alanine dehydrogenase-like protein (mu-crystallin family)|uniref:ornithine cyclodeaminase family protein n=1 Tax=Metallibacterium scheffleri TaxID=993689 RepID=UPI0026EA3E1A|nr:ornithine cyclodeaminase family protein [Metallibacterium scheffleri]MCK9368324.1 ornithine cyclodeaminase family protein [Metallibacterium scheffleri]
MSTLVLSRAYVAGCAQPSDYIRAIESAFLALANGDLQSLPVGHIPAPGGGFHIKAAVSAHGERRAAIKINGNFPDNPGLRGLPTIQGCIVLTDAADGRLLAVVDTIEITAQRTAAASAVAARHLARRDAATIAFIGCGFQSRYHLEALLALGEFTFRAARCFDHDPTRAEQLRLLGIGHGLDALVASSPGDACRNADVIVTCTPAKLPVIGPKDIKPGAFIAAVGADSPAKSEIAPELMAIARVVPDITAQAAAMGDLRAAIQAGSMRASDVHAELAQVVSSARPGRVREADIFVFDSTGTAIQDLAAAAMIYDRACVDPAALRIDLNGLHATASA